MKSGLSMARQMIMYHIVVLVISLLFLWMMGESYWLQAVLDVVLLAAYGYMLYADGGSRGEKAATLSVQIERQREEGRAVDPLLEKEAFSKKTAFWGYCFGVLPLLLIALLNLAVEPLYPAYEPLSDEQLQQQEQLMMDALQQQVMPEMEPEATPEAAPLEGEVLPAETALPEATETLAEEVEEAGPINWVSVVARVAFAPYIIAYQPLMNRPHVLYLLFVVFALALPVLEPIGYLQGPKLRKKKLEAIEKGKKKKLRNLRVNKKPRKPKPPKMEV